MSAPAERTRQSLAIVAGAITFGLVVDVLARSVPARLDVALAICALLLIAGVLVHRGGFVAPDGITSFGAPFAVLLIALIWRDSETLFALNLLGMGLLAVLASPAVCLVGWARSGLTRYAHGAAQLLGAAMGGTAVLVFGEIDWRVLPPSVALQRARGTLVGLVAAAPVAFVLGGLLMDADPIFGQLMSTTLVAQLDRLGEHGVAMLFWAWIGAGVLRLFLLPRVQGPPRAAPAGRCGLTEVATVLVVLDLLFLAFVVVQFRYLFGGGDLVRAVSGLSYAEYARQGFFQLVAVAALSLGVLLVTDWALGRRARSSLRQYRLLASVMLILLNVMLASALWRMRLYTAEYGLTELRFYTTAFMGWLVLVFGWFAATVLRARRHRFGPGALTAGFLVLGALNLVNPDAIIAGTNLSQSGRALPVDAPYAASLSADAVPTILRLLPRLSLDEQCALVAEMGARWASDVERRGRWTISLAQAGRRLRGRVWLDPVPRAANCFPDVRP
jgi:hypothetical protein